MFIALARLCNEKIIMSKMSGVILKGLAPYAVYIFSVFASLRSYYRNSYLFFYFYY